MTKNDANRILDRIREGYPMPLAIATQALQRTGDIAGLSNSALRTNGDEPSHHRPIKAQMQGTESRISYSRYLDCPTNKGVKE